MTIIDTECITGKSNLFVNQRPIVHDQKVTIHHWQLRDLLLTDKQFGDDIILPRGHDIYRYNHITGQRDYLLRDIGYNPTCMASGFGYWAAGGQHGDLTLKDIKTHWQMSINSAPGCTINNGLCFSRCMNGDIRLLVSNNDTTIRVFSVPDLNLIDTLDFRTAVNHTSVSPNGRMMITVGDDNRVLLFSISYSGNYELIQTMAVSNDANFSIAWNHTSDKFAVSSQDGSVHVWDIRHSDPIAKFTGVNSSITKGAARCVKFTQAGAIDLLAFTEHVSHVHVVDARTFDGQQTLRIGSNRYDTPITGLSFSVDRLENSILDFNIDTGIRRRFPGGLLI